MKPIDQRRSEAAARQKKYNLASVEDKLAKLDRLFGVGLGAARERKKLAKELELRDAEIAAAANKREKREKRENTKRSD